MIAEEAPLGKITTLGVVSSPPIRDGHPPGKTTLPDQPVHELKLVGNVVGPMRQLVGLGKVEGPVHARGGRQRFSQPETARSILIVQRKWRTPRPRTTNAE